ncbi:MAG: DNA cytosine methyltransferase, partial [Candidatus Paceibacterota bacterium]
KSGLFFEYVRLLKETSPKHFLLENVRMKKEHQDSISSILGCEPIVINSQLVAPHLRHRLYWTNIPNITQPKDLGLKLNDFLIDGFSDRDKARTLLESDSRPLSTPIKMCHRYFNTGFTTLIFRSEKHYTNIKKHFDINFKGKSAKEIDILIEGMDLSLYNGVRYMNNREREACQTVPQGYTDNLTQNESACVLGDGWTVDVIAHIFKNIKNEN